MSISDFLANEDNAVQTSGTVHSSIMMAEWQSAPIVLPWPFDQ
jgi:hypothetical protein